MLIYNIYLCKYTANKISKIFNTNHNVRWIVGNLYNKYEIINKLESLPFIETNYKNLKSRFAEAVRFELTVPCGTPVFKTGALNHYATPPYL